MKELFKAQQEHLIPSIEFTPDGQNIVTANQGGMILIYDLNGNVLNQVRASRKPVQKAVVSPDGKNLITGGGDGFIQQYSLPSLELTKKVRSWSIIDICFSPDGEMLAMSHCHSKKATLWDKSLNLLADIEGVHKDWVEGIAFAPDSQTLLTTSHDGTFALWNTKERMLVKRNKNRYICQDILQGETATDIIYDAAFSPDGGGWGVACKDGYVRLKSTKTADTIVKMPHADPKGYATWVLGINFSNDGIVRTLTDDTINFWDVQGVLMEWYHPAEQMRCFAFSDNLMAVGCYDGTVGVRFVGPKKPLSNMAHT